MRPSSGGSSGFFSPRELMRLSSAIFLLGIVALLALQSMKSSSWRKIAAESERDPAEAVVPVGTPWKERVVPHPGHTDPEEKDALKEEMQAISDQTPLAREEMPAYWRMVKWAYAVPGEELKKQARTDLLFTHLFQAPNQHRGELVNVKLHVRRILQHDAPQNSANVTRVYEAWGPSDDSQTFPYCVVFVDVPPGVAVKPSVFMDARFVGFFHKKLAYEDGTGVKRSAPLLIGRMLYDTTITDQQVPDQQLGLGWIVAIVVLLIAGLLLVQGWAKVRSSGPRAPLVDEAKVDAFLDDLERGVPPAPAPDRPEIEPPD